MRTGSWHFFVFTALPTLFTVGSFTSFADANETYEVTERAYVISAGKSVDALCEPGDALISGACHGVSRADSAEEPHHEVFLDGAAIENPRLNGWSCKTRILRATQIARVSASAKCVRHLKTAKN